MSKIPGLYTFFLFWFMLEITSMNTCLAQTKVSIELYSGVVSNIPTPLKINQNGQPPIDIDAKYHSRPLDDPYYYVLKLNFPIFKSTWQLQFTHHKLFLSNPPPDVQKFEITHGFNLLILNRLIPFRSFDFLIGAGLVLPHPESEIRHKKYSGAKGIFGTGYHIRGPVFLLGLGKKFKFFKNIYFALEGQCTGAIINVSVAEGKANVRHLTLHGLFGFGYRLN